MKNVKMVRVEEQINKEIQLLKLKKDFRNFSEVIKFLLDNYNEKEVDICGER